jgi:muconolactone delta-isomerase
MRFLVISYGIEPLDFTVVGDAAPRSHRYRDRLMAEGTLLEHAHLAGQRGHAWVFEADSVDGLDRIVAADPMSRFCQNDPVVLPLTSYSRMAESERDVFGVAAADQMSAAEIERLGPNAGPGKQRFLVIAYRIPGIAANVIGDAPSRAFRYREELMRKGKLSLHGHIAGQQGHVWIYHVDSVDELDEVMSADPMSGFYQNNPIIHAFCSYERMHDRERQFFPDAVAANQ